MINGNLGLSSAETIHAAWQFSSNYMIRGVNRHCYTRKPISPAELPFKFNFSRKNAVANTDQSHLLTAIKTRPAWEACWFVKCNFMITASRSSTSLLPVDENNQASNENM